MVELFFSGVIIITDPARKRRTASRAKTITADNLIGKIDQKGCIKILITYRRSHPLHSLVARINYGFNGGHLPNGFRQPERQHGLPPS